MHIYIHTLIIIIEYSRAITRTYIDNKVSMAYLPPAAAASAAAAAAGDILRNSGRFRHYDAPVRHYDATVRLAH